MPIETWTRPSSMPREDFFFSRKGTPIVHRDDLHPIPQYYSCTQTTTSFRSRGDQSHLDVPDTPLELLRASTQDSAQLLFDSSHYRQDLGAAGRDTGHPFSTQRNTIRVTHPWATVYGSQGSFYQGPIMPSLGGFETIPPIDTMYYGPKAISNTIPTKSIGNLSTALGEILRDGFPRLGLISLPDKINDFRKLGDDYLNVEFGWKPFLADLQSLAYAVINSAKILEQYQRDSGRIVRRRFSFPDSVSTYSAPSQQGWALNGFLDVDDTKRDLYLNTSGQPDPGRGTLDFSRSVTERYSFSGAYSYYLAPDDNAMNSVWRCAQLADKLIGFGITPATLWELAPWSWLVDWVTNMGSIINNASLLAKDGLVIRWGYLMRYYDVVGTTSITGVKFYRGPDGPFSSFYRSVRKERVKATPFGFGLNTDSFTVRQWAILAALGMTKSPRIAF